MKFPSLRRSDVQAQFAFALALLSVAPCLGAAILVLRNYQWDLDQIVYGAEGRFLPVFLTCLTLAALSSGVGFVLGWASSGHRRNDKTGRSWFAFFVGGLVLTLTVIMGLAFFMLRFKSPV